MEADVVATLLAERGRALTGYAYLLCGDVDDAEDLVQDALVKTYARGRVATQPTNVEGYVRRAILSTFLDGFRRRRRWAAMRHLVEPAESTPGPEQSSSDRIDVRAALEVLSPRERACVVLRYYEDMTVARIADELSISEGAVKRYLSDGVRRMEDLLGPVATPTTPENDSMDVRIVTTARRAR